MNSANVIGPRSEIVARIRSSSLCSGLGGGRSVIWEKTAAPGPAPATDARARRCHDGGRGGALVTEPRVLRVLAPNPGPFTLEGTNTWVVGEFPALVIDPGPDDTRHLEGLLERAGEIGAVLVTHHHADHASGAGRLARLAGVPVM